MPTFPFAETASPSASPSAGLPREPGAAAVSADHSGAAVLDLPSGREVGDLRGLRTRFRTAAGAAGVVLCLAAGASWAAGALPGRLVTVVPGLALGVVVGLAFLVDRGLGRAAAAERRADRRHAAAARAVRDGLFDWDVVAGRTDWCAETDRILGPAAGGSLAPEDRLDGLLHVDETSRWTERIWPVLGRGEAICEELRLRDQGGGERWVEIRAGAVRDDEGRLERVLGFVRDVTERREGDRFREEFLSTVSHELRTPLTAIKGAIGLLAGDVAPEKTPRLVDMALRNVSQLESLVDDLLDIQKLVEDFDSLEIRILDPIRVTREAGQQLARIGENRGISLDVAAQAPDSPGVRIVGDERRLLQVLSNLISNAVKFSPDGRPVELRLDLAADAAVWTVADRGIGIPDDVGDRVFERFWQLEKGDARRFGGTGLGLAIARSIVKLHGGTIGYRARDGGGTEFEVRIPLRQGDGAGDGDFRLPGSGAGA